MKIRNLVGAVLLAGAALAITSSPASANHTEVCVGQGRATITGGDLYYPGAGPSSNGGFALNTPPQTTVCTGPSNTIAASGTFGPGPVAYCGHSTGTGTVNGHAMIYVSAGSILVITGEVTVTVDVLVGVANAIPDALNGESCVTGADQFIVTGAVAFIA